MIEQPELANTIIGALVAALLTLNFGIMTFIVGRLNALAAQLTNTEKDTADELMKLRVSLNLHEKTVAANYITKADLAERMDASTKPILQSLSRVESMLTASLMPRMNELERIQARQDAEIHIAKPERDG